MDNVKVDNFRKLIKEMYVNFPNAQVRTVVEKVVITEEMRKHLVDSKFLLNEQREENGQIQEWYMLGPSSLSLLSSWETEDLTKSIRKLTCVIIALTVISIVILIIK